MRIEPTITGYRHVRNKKHGIGKGSHLLAFKLALCVFCISNGGPLAHWYTYLAYKLAYHWTPLLPRMKGPRP